jgi:hypothetical protein
MQSRAALAAVAFIASLAGCAAPRTVVRNPVAVNLARIHASMDTFRRGRLAMEDTLRSTVITANTTKLQHLGDKQYLFRQARDSVCFPVALADEYNRIAASLLLFDQAETEQVGKWLSYVEGGAGLGGVASLIGAFSTRNVPAATVGAVGIGIGALFAMVRAWVPNGVKPIEKALLRVEFNRQMGLIIRQHTGSIAEIVPNCKELKDYVATFDYRSDNLEPSKMEMLKTVLAKADGLYVGIMQVGASAQQISDEINQKLLHDPGFIDDFVVQNIKNIASARQALGDEWALHQADIVNALNCITTCQSADN